MRFMKNKIIGAQALAFANGATGGFYAFIDVIGFYKEEKVIVK